LPYEEALNRCLEALREGRELEDVIASMPEGYAPRLRDDIALTLELRRRSAALPPPDGSAERMALARMQSELSGLRVSRLVAQQTWRGRLALPRLALVGVFFAFVLAGAALLLLPSDGYDSTVEAATLEGVVVASGEGNLVVQTLDSLEEVTVPLDAQLADETGGELDLASIEVGHVVLVEGNRRDGGPVLAANVRRLLNGIPGWCTDAPARCRQIAQSLRQSWERCRDNARACRLLQDRVDALIEQAGTIAELEDLKQRCSDSELQSCQDIVSRCRVDPALCVASDPPRPALDRLEDARERLQALQRQCAQRDTSACRQVGQICAAHPVLCPGDSPRAPDSRPQAGTPAPRLAPSPTPAVDQRRVPAESR
jgi:hypothetical protein